MNRRLLSRRTWRRGVSIAAVLMILLSGGIMSNRAMDTTAYAATCNELLTNGGMESDAGWTLFSAGGSYSLFSDYQVRSGSRAAYLAGVNNAQDSLTRSLALPANTTVALKFWWLVNSEESGIGADGMQVLVKNSAGQTQQVAYAVSDQSAGLVWQQASVDLSKYAGQTIQLQFAAQTDGSLTTDFFVDDVSVSACGSTSADAGSKIYLPFTRR